MRIGDILERLRGLSDAAVRVEIDSALMRPSDAPILVGDSTRLRQATGWSPDIAFDQTLDDLLTYWRSVVHS